MRMPVLQSLLGRSTSVLILSECLSSTPDAHATEKVQWKTVVGIVLGLSEPDLAMMTYGRKGAPLVLPHFKGTETDISQPSATQTGCGSAPQSVGTRAESQIPLTPAPSYNENLPRYSVADPYPRVPPNPEEGA
ncbi:hypothetical protein SERLA73DRAFT_74200 [Serpula lacrymans var. lacrymans S7.3]|uniref:Uncharacterized protein n=1 Tax=Serpula lacrymans var. lacrymans (strain S7.3) TaxID=936435 RepID=F8Q0W9_SERL3|nr:hypothetical protein SERLA73DRAFT_74200 [Serpula lacrymans var. lacrymans S7.3]